MTTDIILICRACRDIPTLNERTSAELGKRWTIDCIRCSRRVSSAVSFAHALAQWNHGELICAPMPPVDPKYLHQKAEGWKGRKVKKAHRKTEEKP